MQQVFIMCLGPAGTVRGTDIKMTSTLKGLKYQKNNVIRRQMANMLLNKEIAIQA